MRLATSAANWSACRSASREKRLSIRVDAEAGGHRSAGHVAQDEADQGAGAGGRNQLLHAVAMGDMANLMGEDAGEFVGRFGAVEQGGKEIDFPARQREGIGHVGLDHGDIEGEGRARAFQCRCAKAGDGAVGEAIGVWIANLEAVRFA